MKAEVVLPADRAIRAALHLILLAGGLPAHVGRNALARLAWPDLAQATATDVGFQALLKSLTPFVHLRAENVHLRPPFHALILSEILGANATRLLGYSRALDPMVFAADYPGRMVAMQVQYRLELLTGTPLERMGLIPQRFRVMPIDPLSALLDLSAHGLHDDLLQPVLHPTPCVLLTCVNLAQALNQTFPQAPRWLSQARALVPRLAEHKEDFSVLQSLIAEHQILIGEAPIASESALLPDNMRCTQRAMVLLAGGDLKAAQLLLDQAQKLTQAYNAGRAIMPGLGGVLNILMLIALDDDPARKRLRALSKMSVPVGVSACHEAAHLLKRFIQARESGAQVVLAIDPSKGAPLADVFVELLLLAWTDSTPSEATAARARAALETSRARGWLWLSNELSAVLHALYPKLPPAQLPALVNMRSRAGAWDEILRALNELADAPAETVKRASDRSQLQVQLIDGWGAGVPQTLTLLELRAQKEGFSAGRRLASSKALVECRQRLVEGSEDARLLDACMAVASFPKDVHSVLGNADVLDALVGHPRAVFGRGSKPPQPIKVLEGKLDIRLIELKTGDIQVSVSPDVSRVSGKRAMGISADTLRVYTITNAHRRLLASVGEGVLMPRAVIEQVAALAPRLARVANFSSDLKSLKRAPLAGLEQLHVLLEPRGGRLNVSVQVRPFGIDRGPYFEPAVAPVEVLGAIDGEILTAKRDLNAERVRLDALSLALPLLAGGRVEIDDPEAALDLILQLQSGIDGVTVAWPQGGARSVVRAKGMQVAVSSKRDWLDVEATLELDDERTLTLAQTLDLFDRSRGGYVEIADNQFVRLSDSLRAQLAALKAIADGRGKVQISKFAAPLLEQALGSAFAGSTVQTLAAKMAQAQALKVNVPATFEAELRDYQLDGFCWLMRQAAWGAGACLADDMGLGKTVQGLAMLTARAPRGAQMVVAPTSLIGNWAAEALRFAPTLNALRFDPLNAAEQLKSLKPFDLLLISYGLLVQHQALIEPIKWSTVLIDEAQAIKNAATQRAQAVCALDAEFRVATTGTPIENHLGELWSLMRFLNPGLLGSQERFSRRFVGPIERDPAGLEKQLLKRLISPFILRRTKAQVLSELPPRTEITLAITPSEGERKLFDALRFNAIAQISALAGATQPKQFQILAAITRLRRAACHPSLVAPELDLSSAKLERLLKLVEELKENRHRALIFSQFVDFLSLVRARLDSAGVSYQYLDGATPGKERDRAVSAFQQGQGDVFLLSLKAGGVGLNLTAADYVIHLDPWWNPAVEQQASDRAHRIGQTRPVTIYRLVLEGSIEEKILSLHGAKRELMDSMLADTAGGSRLNAEELLALIQSD